MTKIPQTREQWPDFDPKNHPNFAQLPEAEQDQLVFRTENIQSMVHHGVAFDIEEARSSMQAALEVETA